MNQFQERSNLRRTEDTGLYIAAGDRGERHAAISTDGISASFWNSRDHNVSESENSTRLILTDESKADVLLGIKQNGVSTYHRLFGQHSSKFTFGGSLILSNTTDISGTEEKDCALKIGNVSGIHLEFDGNEIMAKASGTTTNNLYINGNGGDVYIASNKLHAKSDGGCDIAGTLTVADGSIVIDNYKGYRSKDTNGDIKTLIHLNTADNVVINGSECGITYINAGTYIGFNKTITGNIVMRNSSYGLKAEDTNGTAQTLIYLTNANYIKIGSSSNTSVTGCTIENNLTCNGTVTSSGAIKSTGGSLIANGCTSYNGGVEGGYVSASGRLALVSGSSSVYPNIIMVNNKSTSAYTVLRATNTSGTYTLTLPASTGTLAVSSSDIRLKDNIKPSKVSALDLIDKISLYEFDWTSGKENNPHWNVGMIADELEKLDKNLAFGGGVNEDGSMNVKGIEMFYLMGYIVKAIQELKDKIKEG